MFSAFVELKKHQRPRFVAFNARGMVRYLLLFNFNTLPAWLTEVAQKEYQTEREMSNGR